MHIYIIHTDIYICAFSGSFPIWVIKNIEYSSLCYTVGPLVIYFTYSSVYVSISLFKYVALTCLQTNFHSALIRMSERKGNNCLSSLAGGSSECSGVRGARDENRTCIYLLTPSLHLSLFLLCPCIYLSFLYALYMPFLRLKTPFIVLIRQ